MRYNVGIVGATGVVGEVALRLLAERGFPVAELRLYASERSAGRKLHFAGEKVAVEALEKGRFGGLDVVVNATDATLAKEWVPKIASQGPVVIDNSSAFRQDPDVPLVIPEINAAALEGHRGIVANPNCTTAVALMAAAPLHREARIVSMISSSYQSVSGTGKDAIVELLEQTRKAIDQIEGLRGHEPLDLPSPHVYRYPLAFNLFPQCETFLPGEDASTEERKMVAEARKILDAPDLLVHPTAVRVPVVVGHSVSLSLSFDKAITPERARELLASFPGVSVLDDPSDGVYPTPMQSAGIDDVLVGRVRANPALRNGLSLFACGDNLRKGAALNAIQIAERLLGV